MNVFEDPMRRPALRCVLVIWVGFAGGVPDAESGEATLRWRNGDELPGLILESSSGEVRWEATPFAAPLEIGLEQLSGLQFSSESDPAAESGPRFRFEMKNGDRINGDFVSVQGTSLLLESPQFTGKIQVKLDAIARVVNTGRDHLSYSGPENLTAWSSSGRDRKPTEWFTDLRGDFATHQWSGNLFRELSIPEKVEVRFTAHFPQGLPNVEIGLLREPGLGPMLETWDNVLVLTHESHYVPVLAMTPEIRNLDLRLFWDQQNGRVRVCAASGKQLAALDGVLVERYLPDPENPNRTDPLARGFSILNRTPEMKLAVLDVRKWDGREIPVYDTMAPRIHLRGRDPLDGGGSVRLKEGETRLLVSGLSIPLPELEEWVLDPVPEIAALPGQEEGAETRVTWAGGSTLSGTYTSLHPGSITVQPSWSLEAVAMPLQGVSNIYFPRSAARVAVGSDQLISAGISLRGTARLGGESGGLVGWLVAGADKIVPLADSTDLSIIRGASPASRTALPELIGRAGLYLVNDEVLIGDLIAISDKEVCFTSPLTGEIVIPSTEVRAVDIGSNGRVLEGFGDSEWEEVEKASAEIEVEGDVATLQDGSFGNPSLLLGDRIHFETEWTQSYGAMTLRLFASGPDPGSASTDLIIATQGNRLFIGKLKESGAFSFSADQITIEGNRAKFEIVASRERIEVIVNGTSALILAAEPESLSGNGIYFTMGGGWQNWNQADNEIKISGFRVERSPGSLPHRIIDKQAREHILTVPRAQRESAPTHAIVAPNGDVLRGGLVSASGNEIVFRSAEEDIVLPRNRVATIIWLREDPAATEGLSATSQSDSVDPLVSPTISNSLPAETFAVTHQFVMIDGSRLCLAADQVEGSQFVGKSALLGECRFSMESVREMRSGPPMPTVELNRIVSPEYHDWVYRFAPEPVIPDGSNGDDSPLVGKPAPDFEVSMLDETVVRLEDLLGQVVVLDFWASWSGPSAKVMPDIATVLESFPDGLITYLGINQGESPAIINEFLTKRGWETTPTALDFDMDITRDYLAENIPYTVVIGADSVVRWVHAGYDGKYKMALFEAIAAALQP